MKEKLIQAKDMAKEKLDKLSYDWSTFTWEHPLTAGAINGMSVVYFSIVISAYLMKFRGRELG